MQCHAVQRLGGEVRAAGFPRRDFRKTPILKVRNERAIFNVFKSLDAIFDSFRKPLIVYSIPFEMRV